MWHDMFALGVPVIEKVLRALLLYGFVVLALRVSGKRELAQLNPLDFTVLLMVANAIQNGIIGDDNSITGAVIGAATLFIVNGIVERAAVRSRRAREVVEGKPTPLVQDGKYLDAALKHAGLSRDEVEAALAEQGVEDVTEVESAALLPNGHFTVKRRPTAIDEQRHNEMLQRLDRIERMLGGHA